MKKTGLFIGLTTLDFIYLTKKLPQINKKIVAIHGGSWKDDFEQILPWVDYAISLILSS